MMTQRTQQTDQPRDLPPLPGDMQPAQRPALMQPEIPELARLAGALSALAGRVERQGERIESLQRPRVTKDQRVRALDEAREWVTGLGVPPGAERIHAELSVARYLTGE